MARKKMSQEQLEIERAQRHTVLLADELDRMPEEARRHFVDRRRVLESEYADACACADAERVTQLGARLIGVGATAYELTLMKKRIIGHAEGGALAS
jgi:hypothetical protein